MKPCGRLEFIESFCVLVYSKSNFSASCANFGEIGNRDFDSDRSKYDGDSVRAK